MPVPTYTKAGAKATTPAKLDKAVFGVAPTDHALLHSVYEAYRANGRGNLAITKTRGLISGGGRKPWRQKGTGRARFGSSRNPIWRGGGIVFGPTGEENYSKQVNTKAKQAALRQALSLSADANKISVIASLESKAGKTAELARLLAKVAAARNTLLVVSNKTVELERASANLATVRLVTANYLNVFDVMNADTVLIEEGALSQISDRLGKGAKA